MDIINQTAVAIDCWPDWWIGGQLYLLFVSMRSFGEFRNATRMRTVLQHFPSLLPSLRSSVTSLLSRSIYRHLIKATRRLRRIGARHRIIPDSVFQKHRSHGRVLS